MAMEYYSFDKVLNELQMDEDELKRLVSEGQIRAYRDQNRMKFRRDDIDSLKKGKQTEPTIILPDGALDEGGAPAGSNETILDLDGGITSSNEDVQSDESSVPSVDMEGGNETLTEELVFDEADQPGGGAAEGTEEMNMEDLGSEATQKIDSESAFEEEEPGMQTEPLSGLDEESSDPDATVVDSAVEEEDFTQAGDEQTEEADADEGEATVVAAAPKGKKGKAAPPKKAAKPEKAEKPAKGKAAAKPEPAPMAAAPASKPVGILWVVLLAFVAIFNIMAVFCLYDFATRSFTGVSETIGKNVSESNMLLGEKWRDPDYSPSSPMQVNLTLMDDGKPAAGAEPVAGGGQ